MSQLINNSGKRNVRKQLEMLAADADEIKIAVAFYSNSDLINSWNNEQKKITLIVSLRPPTSYFALKDIQTSLFVDTYFLGEKFHSKFWIFYKKEVPFAALLGSSNFSDGGLIGNIEANVLIQDDETLSILDAHFMDELFPEADKLQPSDLDEYKTTYLNYLKRKEATKKDVKLFINKILSGKRNKTVKPCKEARQFFTFWRIVNEIRDLIKLIADKHCPGEPYYFVLDHFWHWVTVVWYKEQKLIVKPPQQRKIIPKLFLQYVKWRNEDGHSDYMQWMIRQSKTVFKKYLSRKNINKLTKEQALQIYKTLHSSTMPIQRFSSDNTFMKRNSIAKIRKSFSYLLYSNDSMDVRIHNLLKNPDYKLHKLASSGVQEINGWMNPEKLPIRNDKADDAVIILGYNLNNL